ncbi:MAG: late competence development ComFB family protein [Candidatus Omnitrophota bacterium]
MNAHNIMEDIVKNHLNEILAKRPDLCKCSKCVEEIMARVLNNLPAKYITTDSGAMHTLIDQVKVEQSSKIIKELMKGLEYLQKHPVHN